MDPLRNLGISKTGFGDPGTYKINGNKNSPTFQDTLKNYLANVNDQLKKSDQMTENFALGKNNNIQEVMLASAKAELSLKFLMQIRNKLMDAYQEIMRMSV